MTSRARHRTLLLGSAFALVLVGAGCSSSSKTKQTVDTTVATTTTIPIATTTTLEATTTTISRDQILQGEANDCTAYVPVGAYSGVQRYIDLWNFVAQDATQLAALCASFVASNPSQLDAIESDYQTYLGTTSSTTADSTPTATTTTVKSSATTSAATTTTS